MARTDARSSSLRRRPSRTVPAAIAAVGLAVAGVAGVWATVVRLAGGSWPTWVGATHRWIATQTWGSAIVITVSIAVALLGLLLLVTALVPGKPNAYEIVPGLRGASDSTEFVMTRAAVAKLATAHAHLVSGVDSVSAVVTGRRVHLTVTTASGQAADLAQRVTAAVTEAITAARLSPQPRVATSVRTRHP